MSDTAWEVLSNQAIAAAGLVYFLALLAHLVEWAALRQPAAEQAEGAVAASSGAASLRGREQSGPVASVAVAEGSGQGGPPAPAEDARYRVALFGRIGLLLTVVAVGAHAVSLLGRGMAADPNRVPWGNMYEFTVSGTFFVALMYLVLRRRYRLEWMAPLVLTFVVSLLMVAVIWLHTEVAPLTEALNSYWLVIHVVAAAIATGAFTLGGITSVMFLAKERHPEVTTGLLGRVPSPARLDTLSYRIHAFGFPVWTFAVLITGPIWAHQAWSSYWNWDPKEVWAFITWVVYAAYLHARTTAGWRGRKAAYLALLGIATLWFNFIGINYFSSTSQHSYAAPAVVAPAVVAPAVAGPFSV